MRPLDLTVVVEGLDLSLLLEEHGPERLILHETFDRMSMKNDIALILLRSPTEFSNEKIPICLSFMNDINTWQHRGVAGWGTTSAGEMLSGDVFANRGWFLSIHQGYSLLIGVTHTNFHTLPIRQTHPDPRGHPPVLCTVQEPVTC